MNRSGHEKLARVSGSGIRTVEATMQALQKQAKALLKGDSVDAFLADRRKDAARENGEA